MVAVRNQEGRVLGVIAEFVFRARGSCDEVEWRSRSSRYVK
jgi:hypothetical protein